MDLATFHRNWERLFQAAVWLTSAIVLVVTKPPRFLVSDPVPDTTVLAVQLIVALLVGMSVFFFKHARSIRSRRRYLLAGLSLLATAIALYISYQFEIDAWTCSYDGRGPVIVGSSFTADARQYVLDHPETTCERLLQVSAGMVENIWPKGEVIFHHLVLIGTFFLSVISFALSILFVTFSVSSDGKTSSL